MDVTSTISCTVDIMTSGGRRTSCLCMMLITTHADLYTPERNMNA